MVLRIFEMIATSGFLTALECTKFVFVQEGSASDPTGGAYSAPSDPLAVLRVLLLRDTKEGKGEGRGEKRIGRDRPSSTSQNLGSAPKGVIFIDDHEDFKTVM